MRRSFILAGIAVATLVASFAGADAQQPMERVQVGVLECRGGASIGFIVGSVTNLGCVLRVEGMPEDRYVATIRKVGVDLGITQEIGAGLGRLRAGGPARAGRSLGQLRRRAGQRRRSASGSAAMCWSAARTIRSRCSRSACRARSVSTSPPGWKAWNCGRGVDFSFAPLLRCIKDGERLQRAALQRRFSRLPNREGGGAFPRRPNQGPSSK